MKDRKQCPGFGLAGSGERTCVMLRGSISALWMMILIVVGFMGMALPARGEEKKPQPEDKVAIVNGAPIEKAEFDGEVMMIQKTLLGSGKPLTCKQVSSIQKEVLESLIRREILYQESRSAGIRPDEKAVDEEIKDLRKQFSSEAEFKKELRGRNMSEEVLRSRIEKNNSIQQYIERRFLSKVAVPDNDVVSYYEGHLDLFKQPLQIRISHILIKTDPKWEASRKEEARRKAEQILKDLKRGKDFAMLAREQSDGPTRTNGGDLGYIRRGQLEKPIESVVFNLKPGETSGIVETSYGFHLFRMTDKKPETILAYDEVKEKVRQFLREEKAKQEAELQAKALRDKAGVEVLMNRDADKNARDKRP
jgi:peptidyl-prolyl cis-trans isomerase C